MIVKHNGPMKSDIKEKADAYLLEINLPGCEKEDIKAYIEDGYLNISASTVRTDEKKEGKYICRECYSGKYSRSFYVGSSVSQEDLKATYRHGVLKIEIPKKSLIPAKLPIMIEG